VFAVTQLGELMVLPKPLAGGEGALCPSPVLKNTSPKDKFLATPMGSVSNQNCRKGFHFKEKVEKAPL